MRDAAARNVSMAEWGTELGQLYLQGKLGEPGANHESHALYEAGKRWGRLKRALDEADGISSGVRSGSVVDRGRGHPPEIDQRSIERSLTLNADFDDACKHIKEGVGAGYLRAVRWTCEDDRCPSGHQGLHELRVGLRALAQYWGLVPKTRS